MIAQDNSRTIVVDIDGTICSMHEDYRHCELLPGCLEALETIRAKGYSIFLYTGRHINNYDVTVEWLRRHGVIYDHIIFGKPPAKYYIDDRAVAFTTWNDVMEKIRI